MKKERNISTQLFIEINSKNGELSIGRFKNTPFQKIYLEKGLQDYSKIKEIISSFKNPLYYVHGYFSATKNILKRTFVGFNNFLKDSSAKNDGIIHIIWDARTLNYFKTYKIIDQSKGYFSKLINAISDQDLSELHLMCHSMGNKLFLESIKMGNIKANTFTSLILSAPDISLQEFKSNKKIFESISKKTIILSHTKDKVLSVSRFLNKKKRLGHIIDLQGDNIDVLDCSNVSNEQNLLSKLNKHFYFVSSNEVRNKLHNFLSDSNLSASKKSI